MPGRDSWRNIEKDKTKLHCVFVDLKKAFDRVPRDELWHCMRTSEFPEPYISMVQNMYKNNNTLGRKAIGTTEAWRTKDQGGGTMQSGKLARSIGEERDESKEE